MLNELIKAAAEANVHGLIYDLHSISSYILAVAFAIWYGKKLQISVIKSVALAVIVYLCSNYSMLLLMWIWSGFTGTSGANVVAQFVFVPLYGFLCSKIMKCSKTAVWDLAMCVPLIIHIVCRWGCVFMGCCRGFPSEWGIYNLRTDCIVFPIQIIESVVALLILCGVLYRSKRRNYVSDGFNVPIVLITYGVARFFLEYFHDNSKYVFGLSKMAIYSIIMVVVGVIVLRKLRKAKLSEKNS